MSTPTTPGPDDKPQQTPLPPQTPQVPASQPAETEAQAKAGTGGVSSAGAASGTPTTKLADGGDGKPPKDGAGESAGKGPWWKAPVRGLKKVRWRRNPWVTVGGIVLALLVVAAVGYFAGLGPMSRLNTARGIEPPVKLGGLDRVTDAQIREQLKLDQTREALSRINDGKQATVEAYGNLDGQRLFVVIALRGKVDIDKTIKDSGASPEMVKQVGDSTCVESSKTLPTQCYRGSNTLTIIAQAANEGVSVNDVGPLADEAFAAMK
ncbi:hypothetical protein [Kribbella sp. CA-293567]|uniref:hypothetical protein n=1 Tax=Kribbella sp. CA-293567 TaxID=3002436 RepID=UPI0022DD5EF2|nr:hypothetical protein [Kribbella sp. CA-293567]WBQ03272.1 hypothetical protein OX958_25225 [Kribbella sp. CA-293567]